MICLMQLTIDRALADRTKLRDRTSPDQVESIYNQAENYRLGRHQKRDLQQAMAMYEIGCGRDHSLSCWRLANLVREYPLQRPLVVVDNWRDKASKWYARACNLKFGDACIEQTWLWESAKRETENVAEYKGLLQKACQHQSGRGCYNLFMLEQQAKGLVAGDQLPNLKIASPKARKVFAQAIKYFQSGCKQGREADCFYLGYFHFQGILQKNFEQARSFFERSCVLHHANGCDYLGLMFGNGTGVKVDHKLARRYHQQACELGLAEGCMHYGGMYFHGLGGDKDLVKARNLYENACKIGLAHSCLLWGEMVIRGEGGDRDVRSAFTIYQRACKLNNAEACKRYQQMRQILFPSEQNR
jgi:hypothetical protein